MRPQWKTCKWTKQVNKLTYTQSHTCRSNCTSVSSSYRHLMLNLNETMWFKREPWLNLTKLYYTIRWLRLALNNEGRRGCPKATHPKSWGSYTLGVCLGLWFRMSDATEVTRILPKATCAFWWLSELNARQGSFLLVTVGNGYINDITWLESPISAVRCVLYS